MSFTDRMNNTKKTFADAKSRTIVIVLIFLIIIIFAIVYIKVIKNKSGGVAAESSLVQGPYAIKSIPGMGQPTREYAKLQEQENTELANRASKKGTTFVPTVVRTTYLDQGVSQDQLGAASATGCSSLELSRARRAGVTSSELRCRGCSLAALKAAGYTAAELKAAGYTAAELKAAGFNALELRAAGFSAKELKDAGFSAKELSVAGFNASELKNAGFSDDDLRAAGFSEEEIKDANGNYNKENCSARKLQEARSKNVSSIELRRLGCSAAALRNAGYTAAELKAAGFSAGELHDAGFSAKELKDAGFSAEELRKAGFGAADLLDAGFTPEELKAAGFTEGDFIRAGAMQTPTTQNITKEQPATEAIKQENNPIEIKPPNIHECSVETLTKDYKNGVTASKEKAKNCSVSSLKTAGFSAKSLKDAGFNAEELVVAGFPKDELVAAGVTGEEIKANELKSAIEFETQKGDSSFDEQLGRLTEKQVADMNSQELADFMRRQQALMLQQANELFGSWALIPKQQYTQGEKPKEPSYNQTTTAGGASESATTINSQNSNTYKAGSIIFAMLDSEINSDENTPAMATIIQGPLKNSKVLGTFQRVDKKVLLQFSVLSVPALKNSISINAVAIDIDTAKTALASQVDNHYMLRYGALLGSSFVSGFGQAIQGSGGQTTTTPVGTTSTMPKLNLMQQLAVGVGNMAQQLSTQLTPLSNKQPTVKVSAGIGIGLLLMSDLVVPKNQEN